MAGKQTGTPNLQSSKNTQAQATNQPTTMHQPQYRYTMPIEDPTDIQKVLQQAMEGTVTLTNKELFSIAPEVWKQAKDQLTAHCIPTSSANTFASAEDEHEDNDNYPPTVLNHEQIPSPATHVVANSIEDLRTIPLELDGKMTVNAILDEGSQIITLRQDIWQKIGAPLFSAEAMIMESANASRESTLRLLCDLPVQIGQGVFYLQVQVVRNAPYEMLLGRPFLTLTEASTQHCANGDSQITLIDPNTRLTFTIPTRPRVCNHLSLPEPDF